MSKIIKTVKFSDTLSLSECSDGYWLWDSTREMNLAVKAESSVDAFVEALHYYQKRLMEVEQNYREMAIKVDVFVAQFTTQENQA